MIRFMNRNNLNPNSTVFQARVRQNLANAFISVTVLSSMPGIMMALPVGLALGGLRAVLGPKIDGNSKSETPKPEEGDSGVSMTSELATEDVTSSEDEKEMFDYQVLSSKQKFLEFTDSLGSQIQEYLTRCRKSAILVTLRDVATLLQTTSSDSENTVRIQYKKRKLKMMAIPNEAILEILESSKGSEGSPILVYFVKDDVKIQNLDRKFVMEAKEVIGENAEGQIVENSDFEFLVVKKDGVVWVNSGF